MLLFEINMQHVGQNKKALMHSRHKVENNQFRKASFKNIACYYFDDLTELENFDIDNILSDEKLHKKVIFNILYKTLIGLKPFKY